MIWLRVRFESISEALHRDHDAARRRMPLGDQRPVAGIVVPIFDCLLIWKFDNHDAAWPSPFEHFMRASFSQITSAVLFNKRHCLLEVVGENHLVVDLVLADIKGSHLPLRMQVLFEGKTDMAPHMSAFDPKQ